MRRIAAVLGVLLLTGSAAADRHAPHATQQASLGCWDVGAGVTLTLRPLGKHTLIATATFADRPRGGRRRLRAQSVWSETAQAYEVPCRPRSQHGSFCHVAPTAGGLAVRVFALRHGAPTQGRLVEDLVATRCRR